MHSIFLEIENERHGMYYLLKYGFILFVKIIFIVTIDGLISPKIKL